MPRRNRVTPLSEIVADPARGLVYGNRGCLHDAGGRIVRHHAVRRWIACRLRFKDWHRHPLMQPGKFTELFFLDEATAFAAGHRPCALCRREDYKRLLAVTGFRGADAIDLVLDEQRSGPRPRTAVASLPDGAFVMLDDAPHVVVGASLRPWSPGGYGERRDAPKNAPLVTPRALVPVLEEGWAPLVPFLHPSARATMTT
jgi:hypothetical protein